MASAFGSSSVPGSQCHVADAAAVSAQLVPPLCLLEAGLGFIALDKVVVPCRTQLESRLKAMDVRGLFNHLVAYSSRALWSSDTLVVRLCAPARVSCSIMISLFSARALGTCEGSLLT